MFSLVKLAVMFTAALSVAAMPPHMARNPHNHREIAARVAQPEPVPAPEVEARDMAVPAKRFTRRRRASTGRCKPNNSSDTPSSAVKDAPVPSSEPAPSKTPEVEIKPTSTPPQENPEPTPTTTNQPEPTPTPTPTPTPGSGSGGGQVYTGQGTFYATGLGACGITNNDGEDVAAVSHLFYDSFPGYTDGNPNHNPMCGKTAEVTFEGKTIRVKLVDRCEGCAYGDLDFSPHAFNQIASPDRGRIDGISWRLVD